MLHAAKFQRADKLPGNDSESESCSEHGSFVNWYQCWLETGAACHKENELLQRVCQDAIL